MLTACWFCLQNSVFLFPIALANTLVLGGGCLFPGPLQLLPSLPSHCSHCCFLQSVPHTRARELRTHNLIMLALFLRFPSGVFFFFFKSGLSVALKDLCDLALLSSPRSPIHAPYPPATASLSHSFLYFYTLCSVHCVLCLWAFVQVVPSAWNILHLLFYISCFSLNVTLSENPSLTV